MIRRTAAAAASSVVAAGSLTGSLSAALAVLMSVVLTVALSVALSVALTGCVTETVPPAAPRPGDALPSSATAPGPDAKAGAAAAQREAHLGQALVDLDRRVDQFVALSSQPGAEAANTRALLASSLGAQVGQYQTELIALVGDASNPQRRRVAAKSLAFSNDPAAVAPLVKALSERGDPVLLTNATYALGRIHSPLTPTAPLVRLVGDLDADVRCNALLALWHVFDAKRAVGASPVEPDAQASTMPLIETALFDAADPMIRANAAAAIGALGDPRGVDPLVNILRDDNPLVRTMTAIALGKLGDEKAIPSLVKVIDSTGPGTPRRAVLLALTTLLEKKGFNAPADLGDTQRAWEQYVAEVYRGSAK